MALICGTAAWGKNNVPDFRYPETVINDATKQIEKADKKGNHKALVDGLVRLSIAKSQISADYMPEIINHVDSFAARVSDVRAKSLLLGLESDIVVAAYQHESYVRKPATCVPPTLGNGAARTMKTESSS